MALEKRIEQPTGVATSYHRIRSVEIVVESYIDETHRREGKAPIKRRMTAGNRKEHEALIAALYPHVPALDEELADAQPVFEEGQIDASQNAITSK